MSRLRMFARWQGILALALFLSWIGAGATHQHADNPTCQVCKLLHGSAADLARPAEAPSPASTPERVASTPADATFEFVSSLHQVRGPPLS